MKLKKKVANPRCLSYSICNPAVFSLNTKMRQRVLTFGGPRRLSPRKIQYPEVDRRVAGQPAQSASEWAISCDVVDRNSCNPRSVSEVEEAVRMISSTYSSKLLSRNCKAKNSPYGSRFDNRDKWCCEVGGGGGGGGVVGGVGVVCGDGVVDLFVGLFVVVFVEEK
nr:hypothetical protein [Tanacetum cinerariifolium]